MRKLSLRTLLAIAVCYGPAVAAFAQEAQHANSETKLLSSSVLLIVYRNAAGAVCCEHLIPSPSGSTDDARTEPCRPTVTLDPAVIHELFFEVAPKWKTGPPTDEGYDWETGCTGVEASIYQNAFVSKVTKNSLLVKVMIRWRDAACPLENSAERPVAAERAQR